MKTHRLSVLAGALACLAFGSGASFAQNRLYMDPVQADAGDTGVAVQVKMDTDADVYGFSLSLVTDAAQVQFTGEVNLPIDVPNADWSFGTALDDGGRLTWGVVLDVTEPFDVNKVISPGNGIRIADVIVDTTEAASGSVAIEIVDFPPDFISNPPDPGAINKLLLENGDPLEFTPENGVVSFGGGGGVGPFVRGDCNQDGDSRGSPTDGIFLLSFLFSGGVTPFCMAACDFDGNGEVAGSPTDALYFFNFNFLGGPPIKAPMECGLSQLADDLALGCAEPRGCQ